MLCDCALNFGGSWDQQLPLCEFAYNNSYTLVLVWIYLRLSMVGAADL